MGVTAETRGRQAKQVILIFCSVTLVVGCALLMFGLPSSKTHPQLLVEWEKEKDDILNAPTNARRPFEVGTGLCVRNGRYFWWDSRESDITIYSLPLKGGQTRIVHTFPSQDSFLGPPVFGDDAVFCLKRPQASGTLPGNSYSQEYTIAGKKISINGPYLQQDPPVIAPGERMIIAPRQLFRSSEPPMIVRVSLDERQPGAIEQIRCDIGGFDLRSVSPLLTPAGLYWVRPGTDTVRIFLPPTNPKQFTFPRYEIPPRETLMFTGLDGKSHELMAHCLLRPDRYANLIALSRGTVYIDEIDKVDLRSGRAHQARYRAKLGEIAPPQRVPSLVPAGTATMAIRPLPAPQPSPSVGAGSPQVISGGIPFRDTAPQEMEDSGETRLECGGRYYWFEGQGEYGDRMLYGLPRPSYFRFQPLNPPQLVSARFDGSDRRVEGVMRDQENGPMLPLQLMSDQGKLYLLYRSPEKNKPTDAGWKTWLARLSTDGGVRLASEPIRLPEAESVTTLAEPIRAGDFYFSTVQYRKGFLDFLNEKAKQVSMVGIWRVHLPD